MEQPEPQKQMGNEQFSAPEHMVVIGATPALTRHSSRSLPV